MGGFTIRYMGKTGDVEMRLFVLSAVEHFSSKLPYKSRKKILF